ncbi:MAG: hypothetical protein B0D86_00335, partial [Candidatus Sedimenticola endophacoides]
LQESDSAGGFNIKWVAPIGNLILPKSGWQKSRIQRRLVHAGFRSPQAMATFIGIKLLLAALTLLIAFSVAPFIAKELEQMGTTLVTATLVLIALFSFYLPDGILDRMIEQRQVAFSEGFPDAMDMLMVCVEAGMGLDAAINRVGEEVSFSHPQLGEEFRLVALELRAGKDRDTALKAMAERTGVEMVQSLVTVLLQAEHFGTSVASTLREFADEMRTKRIQIAQEKAAKLPVKLIVPVLLFIFPALFMVIFAPAVLQIYKALVVGS